MKQLQTNSHSVWREYLQSRSEETFSTLVQDYSGLVFSTALRRVGGNHTLAEEITQTVFIQLARKSSQLPSDLLLGGWLHRTTCHTASKALLAQKRQRDREHQFVTMDPPPSGDLEATFSQMAPCLDEAVNQLSEHDRQAILLRYYENLNYQTIGQSLGLSEDATRMRIQRALKKLQSLLRRKGISISTTTLGTVLTGSLISNSPNGLAAVWAATALSTATSISPLAYLPLKTLTFTPMKTQILAVLTGTLLTTPILFHQKSKIATVTNDLQTQQVAAETWKSRYDALQAQLANTTDPDLEKAQFLELMKLRGEIGPLRQEVERLQMENAMARQIAPSSRKSSTPTTTPSENEQKEFESASLKRMSTSRSLILGMLMYSSENEGHFSGKMEDALHHLPSLQSDPTGFSELQQKSQEFEFLVTGQIMGLSTNIAPNTIVIRQKEPVLGPDGRWARVYGFADGHSQVQHHVSPDFSEFEEKHLPPVH